MSDALSQSPATDTRTYITRATAWVIACEDREQILTKRITADEPPVFGLFADAVLFATEQEAADELRQVVASADVNPFDFAVIPIHCDMRYRFSE